MTQQFKFGDLVRYKDNENPVLGVVLEEENPGNGLITVQFIDDAEPELVGSEDLEHVPHPDTERLDFVEKIINIDGMVKREMGKGWVLFAEYDLSEPKPLLRDAIDAAMQEQAAEAEAT